MAVSKIWEFIKRDARHLRGNVIALVVIVGIAVVPTFYAWFNIAGSWDPYGNTKNLKVAVANTDEGYTSDLMPVNVNAGERVVADLRESDTIGYEFTDKDEALEGVKSGRYYAAIVIPKDFSRNMVTILSDEPEKPQVLFYQNEKANAIAQIVTEKAEAAVQADIDASFADTVTTVGTGVLKQLGNYMDDEHISQLASKIDASVADSRSAMADASRDMRSYAELLRATQNLLGDGTGALDTSLSSTLDAAGAMRETAKAVGSLGTALDGAVGSANDALAKGTSNLGDVEQQINKAFDTAGGQTGKLEDALTKVNDGYVKAVLKQLQDLQQALGDTDTIYRKNEQTLQRDQLQYTTVTETRTTIAGLNDRVGQAIDELTELSGQIDSTVSDIKQGAADAETARSQLKDQVSRAKSGMQAVQDGYERDIRGSLQGLAGKINGAADEADRLTGSVSSTLASVRDATKSTSEGIGEGAAALDAAAGKLDTASQELADLQSRLESALDSQDMQQLRSVLSASPDALATFISEPVKVERNPIFPIENNGSAMTPFYTTLAIWIGGVVMAALVRATPSEQALEEVGCGHTASYLGRLFFFCAIGLVQATLIMAGDVFYLGTQCAHPLLFFIAGWVASLTFVNIIFALTASFGDVGKAVAVVLMVLQVAGSGGTFPRQMLPAAFQAIYPFLPFVHSENAMRAAMFGLYGNDFLVSLGTLAAFIIPALLLGLVLRRPVIRANEWIEHKLASTKIM